LTRTTIPPTGHLAPQGVLITGLATCGRTAWKSLCLFLVLVLVIVIVLTRTSTSTRILSTWAVGVADAMIEPPQDFPDDMQPWLPEAFTEVFKA
jgi:hypothetical protein